MFTEDVYLGHSASESKVVKTIKFEEDDLVREGLGEKLHKGKFNPNGNNYYIGEWLVDLWGRDKAGTLISECSFGGYDEAEWEGESTLDILRFWKLTKVEIKNKRGKDYYVIYSGKRHWDVSEELCQTEDDFLPVLFSLNSETPKDVEFESEGVYYKANGSNTVAVVKPEGDEDFQYIGSLIIPENVTYKRKKFTVTEIRDVSDCEKLKEVKLPSSIKLIASSAFNACSRLKSINLPQELEEIEEYAFWGCIALKKIILPPDCAIFDSAFGFCKRLKEIVWGEQTFIGTDTFRDCISLESIILPPTIKRIENGAFRGCSNLKTVILNEGLESFQGSAFSGCSIQSLYLPSSVKSVYGKVGCSGFKSFTVAPDNNELCDVDGILYSKDMEDLEQCPVAYEGEVIIPDGVKSITNDAFYYCTQVTKIVIPDSAWCIDCQAAKGCKNLQKVIIGNGVTDICSESFAGCESLSSVEFGENVKRIEEHAFRGCKSLTKVHLPLSVKGGNATMFEGCNNLSELSMPEWLEKHRQEILDYAHGKKSSGWL